MRWIAISACILMAGAGAGAAAQERPILQLDTGEQIILRIAATEILQLPVVVQLLRHLGHGLLESSALPLLDACQCQGWASRPQ